MGVAELLSFSTLFCFLTLAADSDFACGGSYL